VERLLGQDGHGRALADLAAEVGLVGTGLAEHPRVAQDLRGEDGIPARGREDQDTVFHRVALRVG
jgi:hypothetical protein